MPGPRRALAPLTAASQATGTEIVAGVLQRTLAGRHIAVAFEPDGHKFVYAKRHRLPCRSRLNSLPELPLVCWREGKAMAICKDMDFPDTIRNGSHARLRLMAVPACGLRRRCMAFYRPDGGVARC